MKEPAVDGKKQIAESKMMRAMTVPRMATEKSPPVSQPTIRSVDLEKTVNIRRRVNSATTKLDMAPSPDTQPTTPLLSDRSGKLKTMTDVRHRVTRAMAKLSVVSLESQQKNFELADHHAPVKANGQTTKKKTKPVSTVQTKSDLSTRVPSPKSDSQSDRAGKSKPASKVQHKLKRATPTQEPPLGCQPTNFSSSDRSKANETKRKSSPILSVQRVTRATMKNPPAKRVELAEISNLEQPKKSHKRKAETGAIPEAKKKK